MAVKGEEARKSFYNDKGASILEGYKILTGGVRHTGLFTIFCYP
jgi:hypothetical protein